MGDFPVRKAPVTDRITMDNLYLTCFWFNLFLNLLKLSPWFSICNVSCSSSKEMICYRRTGSLVKSDLRRTFTLMALFHIFFTQVDKFSEATMKACKICSRIITPRGFAIQITLDGLDLLWMSVLIINYSNSSWIDTFTCKFSSLSSCMMFFILKTWVLR